MKRFRNYTAPAPIPAPAKADSPQNSAQPQFSSAFATFLALKRITVSERQMRDYLRTIGKFYGTPGIQFGVNEFPAVLNWFKPTWKANTLRLHIANLRTFGNFCVSSGILTANPFDKLTKPKRESKILDLSPEDVRKVRNALGNSSFSQRRNRMMFDLMAHTGVRTCEIRQLEYGDFIPGAQVILIREEVAKTSEYRELPLDGETFRKITEYLPELKQAFQTLLGREIRPNDPLFPSERCTPINYDVFYQEFKKAAKSVGVEFTPYQLRHFFAIAKSRKGINVKLLQGLMGHKSAEMTLSYLRFQPDELRATADKYKISY